MRVFVHAFQGKPWNEECQTAYDGFKKLGVECILFTTNEELLERQKEDIVVGGMLIMGSVLYEDNIIVPNYNYPDELISYFGRNIWHTKVKNLKNEKLPVFIKPDIEKSAKGIVVQSWDEISEYERLDSEAELLCSDVINLVSEWRIFVRYGEILGRQLYNGDMLATCDEMIITNVC